MRSLTSRNSASFLPTRSAVRTSAVSAGTAETQNGNARELFGGGDAPLLDHRVAVGRVYDPFGVRDLVPGNDHETARPRADARVLLERQGHDARTARVAALADEGNGARREQLEVPPAQLVVRVPE